MTVSEDLELAFKGPGALAAMVNAGEIHPRELVELYLGRIEALNPRLNAFRVTLAEQALADAERPKSGPLAGVPIAVKDDLPVEGQRMTWGSRMVTDPQPADAEAVRRLRAAGAIPIGITNVPELMIFPWTASDANGLTRNPWDPSRTPGGSSGGSAAAVAAGLVAAATGSDGGGSIRIPAACCGLVGMKPSRGRVPADPGPDGWLALSVYGALARTVGDSALMLSVMSRDPTLAQAAAQPPRRLRIAISRKLPLGLVAKLSADQRIAFDRTARLLTELGHTVVERDPAYGLAAIEFSQNFFRGIYEEFRKLPPGTGVERSTREMAGIGRLINSSRREKLLARRPRSTARILALWNEVDVLLTPGLARTALPAEGGYGKPALLAFNIASRFTPWTPLFNLTGQPAVAIPAGFGADGLPTSVQLVGRHGDEALLYSLAGELEAAQPWAPATPPLAAAESRAG
ncbi:MAG: amidase [Solirubrobacteraceae bacterium]